MLRRLFRLPKPATSREAFRNLIRAGSWEVGLLAVAAVILVVLKDAFPSFPAWSWALVFVIIMAPPGAATLAVAGELGALARYRRQERQTAKPTGRFLFDHDLEFGFGVVVAVFAVIILLVLFHRL